MNKKTLTLKEMSLLFDMTGEESPFWFVQEIYGNYLTFMITDSNESSPFFKEVPYNKLNILKTLL